MKNRQRFELPILPDPCPKLVVERGSSGQGLGWWVPQVKHTYSAKYISVTRKAQAKFRKRILIDPFCGPGRVQVSGEAFTRDGGAMVAWRFTCNIAFRRLTQSVCRRADIDNAAMRIVHTDNNSDASDGTVRECH